MSSIWTVRRSATDVKLTGLCGGVAEHWGVDPVLVRVGCALLVLSGGVGAVLYLAGWLLIPVEGRDTSPADELFGGAARGWPRGVWLALVALAGMVVLSSFGSAAPFGVAPAVVIGCIWYFGFYKGRAASPPPAGPAALASTTPNPVDLTTPQFLAHAGPPTPFTEAADRWRRRMEEHAEQNRPPAPLATVWATMATPQASTSLSDPDPDAGDRTAFLAAPDPVGLYTEPVGATALQVPLRRRDSLGARRLRLLTVLVLGLVLGGLTVIDQSGGAVVPAVYAASALLVIGLALVAATWFGRARGLLAVGLLLVPVVGLTAVANVFGPLDQWSETTQTYTRVADLPHAPVDLGSGRVTVDLSSLRLTTDATYRARLGAGRLEVVVPPAVNVEVRYDVGYGEFEAFGAHAVGGVDVVGTTPGEVALPNRPTLVLDLAVNGGQLVVR